MKKLTGEWLKKAEADTRVARKLENDKRAEHSIICFHCQQASEKFLKGLLVELSLHVPKIHVREDLLALLKPHHPQLSRLRRGLVFLTRYAVDARYPGFDARRSQSIAALKWAERVRTQTRQILGLRAR